MKTVPEKGAGLERTAALLAVLVLGPLSTNPFAYRATCAAADAAGHALPAGAGGGAMETRISLLYTVNNLGYTGTCG